MQKKKIFITLSLFTLVFVSPSTVLAQTVTITPTTQTALPQRPETAVIGDRLTSTKRQAEQLITQRLMSLNKMLTKIEVMKRLTPEQKVTLTKNINDMITSLTNLQAKIAAETDAAQARADIQSLFTDYQLYTIFDPQPHILGTTDTFAEAINQLQQLADKLEARITMAAAQGNSATHLHALLEDMQAKIAHAQTTYTSVQNSVTSITSGEFKSNPRTMRTIFQNARRLIKAARADMQTAYQDARQIISGLRLLKLSATATGSAKVTNPPAIITPTPTL